MSIYRIEKGLVPPPGRDTRATVLPRLIELADVMEVGDAVALVYREAQMMRTVLMAKGFKCITDGWHCDSIGRTLVFKLSPDPVEPPIDFQI